MGRAIVREPAAFLMDEPLSNLDAKLRVQIRAEILRLQQDARGHDPVRHPRPGRGDDHGRPGGRDAARGLQQVAPPEVLYDRPVNLFVAGFIGSPAMNFVRASCCRPGRPRRAALRAVSRLRGRRWRARRHGRPCGAGRHRGVVGIRPEDLEDATLGGRRSRPVPRRRGGARREARLGASSSTSGSTSRLSTPRTPAELAEAIEADGRPAAPDERPEFVARVNPRSRVAEGEPVRLAVDVDRSHFFDPATGRAISDPVEAADRRPVHGGRPIAGGATSEGASA